MSAVRLTYPRMWGTHNPTYLQISVRPYRGHTWIDVIGDLDLATAPVLNAAIEEAPHRREHSVVLDLTMLTFCDAAGLDVLVDQHHQLAVAGSALVLLNPSPLARRLLTLTGLDRHLDIRPERWARPSRARPPDPCPPQHPDRFRTAPSSEATILS